MAKIQEGKLRILQYDGSDGTSCMGPNTFIEENMLEVIALGFLFLHLE